MALRILTIDAFADAPFSGNPAAVCLLPEARDERWMQRVAREMNLSETAFLVPRPDGDRDLRWFTPVAEVALCGHATLASAHTLWETGALPRGDVARFHTKSGLLTASLRDDGLIVLDFPSRLAAPAPEPPGLAAALGATPRFVGRNVDDYLVELDSEDVVRALTPDVRALRGLPVRGVIVTAPASTGFDFVSRFFAPRVGVDEDPVTGSAHCCLTPFWAERLGKSAMRAYQASARGGVLEVRLRGERVELGGRAITVLDGELRV
jgi:PhzF family phenazine biosynthesis protein